MSIHSSGVKHLKIGVSLVTVVPGLLKIAQNEREWGPKEMYKSHVTPVQFLQVPEMIQVK